MLSYTTFNNKNPKPQKWSKGQNNCIIRQFLIVLITISIVKHFEAENFKMFEFFILKEFLRRVMRIDKFLKVSRIIKRRTVAQEACDGNRIEINGKTAKPSREVKVGDVVKVAFGDKGLTFKVLSVDEKLGNKNPTELYEIVE